MTSHRSPHDLGDLGSVSLLHCMLFCAVVFVSLVLMLLLLSGICFMDTYAVALMYIGCIFGVKWGVLVFSQL